MKIIPAICILLLASSILTQKPEVHTDKVVDSVNVVDG
jgi:hypothetical protein